MVESKPIGITFLSSSGLVPIEREKRGSLTKPKESRHYRGQYSKKLLAQYDPKWISNRGGSFPVPEFSPPIIPRKEATQELWRKFPN